MLGHRRKLQYFLQHIFPQMLRLLFHSHGEPMDFFVCLTHVDGNIYLTMLMLNLHEKYCKPSRLVHFFPAFRLRVFSGSGSDIFSWVRIRIGQKSGSDPEQSGSGSVKKPPKSEVQVEFFFFIFSTLNTVLFGQAPLKHHLDPISLLMDGSGSGL